MDQESLQGLLLQTSNFYVRMDLQIPGTKNITTVYLQSTFHILLHWIEQKIGSNKPFQLFYYSWFETVLQKSKSMFRVFQKVKKVHLFLKCRDSFSIFGWKILQRLITVVSIFSDHNLTPVSRISPTRIKKYLLQINILVSLFLK